MKSKLSKSKIILTTLFCMSFASLSLFALSSCGYVSQDLLDKTIYKGDGNTISSIAGSDLNSLSTFAIENSGASRSYLDNVSNKLALNWIESVASRPGNNDYKNVLENQKKFIDNSFNDLYNSYKKDKGSDFGLLFQQEVLDPAGGTEESWKRNKLFEWTRVEFIAKVFAKDYLTTTSINGDKLQSPSQTDLVNAISGTPNLFSFTSKANESLSEIDTYLDPIYANFHKFIFDKWVQIENPFIINMSLWKYATPKNGLNSVYIPASSSSKPDEEGNTTPTSGSYNFPYFSNDNQTNEARGTIDKFVKFVNDANNNYISNPNYGLIDIPKQHTEDSSTYILAKNGSIYNDLYIEFAAAASYLLYSGKTTAGFPSITNIDTSIQKAVSTTSTATDVITSNFVSNFNLNNSDIKLANSLSSQIINPSGEFKGLLNNNADLFITDAFKASDAKLNQFMFLRNEAGVHAIAIDGKTFIDKATTLTDYKKSAANIVLYRSLMNKNGYSDFGVDVKSELSSFFSSNFTSLIYEFASSTQTNELKMFDPIIEFGQTNHDFNVLLNSYLFDESKYSRKKDFQDKMFNAKFLFTSNYGLLAKDNGLAAPWIYSYLSNNSTDFDLINTPFSPNPFSINGPHTAFLNAINTFITSLNLVPLSSKFEGFEYSQYIYTNNPYINNAIIAYGIDGNAMGDAIKSNVLLKYLGTDFDNAQLSINDSIFSNTIFNNQVGINLNNALNNNFFNSGFNSLSNKWSNLNDAKTNTTISYSNLNSYRRDLWNKQIEFSNSTKSTSYYNLHSLVSTIKYLLSNDAKKVIEYLQSLIYIGQDSYIAWYEGQNSFLDNSNKNVGSLLNISANNLLKNVNNSFLSSYYGNAPSDINTITNNTSTNSVYSNQNNYYNYVGGSVGFAGIQTTANNNAPTPIQERLFSKQHLNIDQVGGLYSYGNKSQMISIINGYSLIQDIDNLVNMLKTKINTISFETVITATTLTTKKDALIKILDSPANQTIINSLFSPRTGYISTNALNDVNGSLLQDETSNNLKYGAKVIQINYEDVKTLDTFKLALGKNSLFQEQEINNIFFNLVVQIALDSNIQDDMLTDLLSYKGDVTNRVDIYDIRLIEQLGVKWIKNWK